MDIKSVTVTLLSFVIVLVLQGLLASAAFTSQKQSGCHNSNVILDCHYYSNIKSGSADLQWRVKDKSSRKWRRIAAIRNKRTRVFNNPMVDIDRLTLHPNGSIEINLLRPEDATEYQCKVYQTGQRDIHFIDLSVECNGKVTVTKKEVCVEDDVLLNCDAKQRTNPQHLRRVMWHKKGNSSWSLVLASNGINTSSDGTKLHGNGSLFLPAGRQLSETTYKCDTIKNIASPRERHIVVLRNVRCNQQSRVVVATAKTTEGSAAMTTSSPKQGITFAMETTPDPISFKPSTHVPSETTISPVCGGSMSSVSGGFQSPNFPSAYPANSYCKWIISVPQDYSAIHITLHEMNLEHEANCQNDFISIYDQLGNEVGCRRCGDYKSPITTTIGGKQAIVVFKSDLNEERTGFKATYTAIKTV